MRDFELEDLKLQIANAYADYDTISSNRLAYLREQALIARKLGVAKNTIETQTFNSQNGMFANVKTDSLFYLRGYEAIEMEIELIESRSNKDKLAFVSGLLELEQKHRALNQDKLIERVEAVFSSTPIVDTSNFSAVSLAVDATVFKSTNNKLLMLILSAVIGLTIGAFFVLISDAIRKNKELLT